MYNTYIETDKDTIMRDLQITTENQNMNQTSIKGFMAQLDESQSVDVIVNMVELVAIKIEEFHNSVKRKRASFFSATKELTFEEVAYIGIKGLFGVMSSTQSMAVTQVGQRIGDLIFTATGRVDEMYSDSEEVEVEKAGSGIKLLDLTVSALPSSFFRLSIERISKTEQQWTVEVSKGFDDFRENNKEIFATLVKRMLPLSCKPDNWTTMSDGGYITEQGKKITPLVKRSPHFPMPKGDTLFKGINHLQATPFRVNKELFNLCLELKTKRPAKLKKVFMEDAGKFEVEMPITEDDQYIWEKEMGVKVNEKTGKEKECEVLVHQDEESKEKRKAFFQWKAQKALHKKRGLARKSIARSYETTLELTESLQDLEEIYWSYSCDNRGRVYPSAMTGINLQGADYQKAVVEFSVALPIGSLDGVYAIKKTVCNHWGEDSGNGVKTDKLTRAQAEVWMTANSNWIVACANSPLENTEWMEADKPLQFLVAAIEWKDWLAYSALHTDFGFMSRLCDPNDASCSGAQILSAMTRDDNGAMHTNMKDMEVQDLYMACAAMTTEILMKTIKAEANEASMAEDWLGRANIISAIEEAQSGVKNEILTQVSYDRIVELLDTNSVEETYTAIFFELSSVEQGRFSLIIRNLVKKPVMVKFYSGTRYGNIEHVNEFIVDKSWEGNFRSESVGAVAAYMGSLIFNAINEVIQGAGQVMEYFVHVAEVLGKANVAVRWTTPVGFKAECVKYATKNVNLKMAFAGKEAVQFIIKVPTLVKGTKERKLDVAKMKSGIAPDIVHSLDAAIITAVGVKCEEKGIDNLLMIHDSLGSHCAVSIKFNRIIRETFIEMFGENDVLQDLYEQFKDQLPEELQVNLKSPADFGIVYGTYDFNEMLSSEFCFK